MSLRLYDTRTRQVRPLVPLREGRVGVYVCGPTVQAAPHVGHLRSAVVLDVLHRWLRELIALKRQRLADDPELFATYCALVMETGEAVREHIDHLTAQIRRIVEDGVARGEMDSSDPAATSRAVLTATGRLHNPAHALEWAHPDIDTAFEEVWSLVEDGLRKKK